MSNEKRISAPTFSPALTVQDEYLAFWLQNVTMRLRREMCWNLQERSLLTDPSTHSLQMSNPFLKKGISELSQIRYRQDKQRFFESDVTAKHLGNLIQKEPPILDDIIQGSLYWLVRELNLDSVSIFVLSLVLAYHLDTAVGNVISLCLNDPNRTQPTLGLAQKLWDRPEEILFLTDPGNALFRYGILESTVNSVNNNFNNAYEVPIKMPPPVANHIIFPQSTIPSILKPALLLYNYPLEIDKTKYATSRIMNISRQKLVVMPILGFKKSSRMETIANISNVTKKIVVHFAIENYQLLENRNYLASIMTFCWLRNLDLYLDLEFFSTAKTEGTEGGSFILPIISIPIILYVGISDTRQLSNIPESVKGPIIEAPTLSYSDRVTYWKKSLGVLGNGIENSILECSSRFRFECEEIENVSNTLKGLSQPLDSQDLLNSCWLEVDLDMGELAKKVVPRFTSEELILPLKQKLQFKEVANAMQSLSRVHHQWGTSKAWNESGISVLFAGPSGSGKTMAAEIMSNELRLPMYKIDLSQVVNKYIGETEKNLKKLFDKAEVCDMILFFDEADSLFGKRTEIKDAHDRYANLEVNYLLERMERYKGLAILATNRIKDIDDAFLRRLRFIIEFPIPKEPQRKIMWRQCIPPSINATEIDTDFLSKQFQLTGGNIRSVVFNACLQSAYDKQSENKGKITMENIIVAVKREYDKLKHAITLEQFGPYRSIVEGIERE